jgi:nucleotide-binding universal stress UspA family protein
MSIRIEHVLVATDFSGAADVAAAAGARLARLTGARVTLVHAYDPLPLSYPAQLFADRSFAAALVHECQRNLEEARARLFAEVEDVDVAAIAGASASLAICDAAAARGADLVVVGTHGRTGSERLFMGSVAEQVIRHATCSVLSVHATLDAAAFPRRILVTTDHSTLAAEAFAPARAIARATGASLTLAHVDVNGAADEEHLLRIYREHLGDEPRTMLLTPGESVAEVLVEHAERDGYDLIAIATHGRTGLSRWLTGSVAEKVARHARGAVLSVRARPR